MLQRIFILARRGVRLHVARHPFHPPMALSLRRLALRSVACALTACSTGHDLDDAALRVADADSTQWLRYGRTYTEQRHSPLQQVDERSIARLGLAWSADFQTLRGLEATPLVSDGVLYGTSAWSVVYAITSAARIAAGRIIIGNAGSEYAVRGFVSAYNARTGALAWRTYMVPRDASKPFESEALKEVAKTWSGQWYKAGGGASPWDPIVYDPSLDLIYVDTGNASPWYHSRDSLLAPGMHINDVSPDLKYLGVRTYGDSAGMYLFIADRKQKTALQPRGGWPVFSPDSQWLAFVGPDGLRISAMPPNGTSQTVGPVSALDVVTDLSSELRRRAPGAMK